MSSRGALRAVGLLVGLVLVASACATTSASTTTQAQAVAAATSEPTEVAVDAALPSGVDAIAAAQGTPHVLWFWGAH